MRNVFILFFILLITACSSTPEERLEKKKPLELTDIEKKVKVKKLWSRSAGNGQGKNYHQLRLGENRRNICAGSVNGKIICVDKNGKQTFSMKLSDELSAGVGVSENTLIVATSNGFVVALDIEDEQERWRKDLTSHILSAPQVASGVVVVQTTEGRVLGLSENDGIKLWEYKNDEPLLMSRGTATPIIRSGIVHVGFGSGKLLAISLETGSPLWDKTIALPSGVTEVEKLVDIDASPQITENQIFAVSLNGNLLAVARRNAAAMWRYPTSSNRETDTGFGNVYVVDEESRILAIDSDDGELHWQQESLRFRQLSAPIVFDGYLVAADKEGYMHLFSQVDGSMIGRSKINSDAVNVPMLAKGDQLYVYSDNGTLSAYLLEAID